MTVILNRPAVPYSKSDVLRSFAILAGKKTAPGKIKLSTLRYSIMYGAGGLDPNAADDILTMMEHIPGGEVDYEEMVELFMGDSVPRSKTPGSILPPIGVKKLAMLSVADKVISEIKPIHMAQLMTSVSLPVFTSSANLTELEGQKEKSQLHIRIP